MLIFKKIYQAQNSTNQIETAATVTFILHTLNCGTGKPIGQNSMSDGLSRKWTSRVTGNDFLIIPHVVYEYLLFV